MFPNDNHHRAVTRGEWHARYATWIASRLLPCPYKRPGWRPSAPVTPFGFPTIDRAEWPFENAPK